MTSLPFSTFKSNLPSMKNKTVVITGTTSGTGRAAAQVIAELGGRLLMLNRPSPRSKRIEYELREAYPDAEIIHVNCDLQSFRSVKTALEQVNSHCLEGIHVLCNNAGIMAFADQATEDGYDIQMQTNHLSHFLLTCELLPLLEKGAEDQGEARIVNHSSIARMNPSKKLISKYLEKRGGDLGGDGFLKRARWVRYNQTKLANCAFTADLHHKLQTRDSKIKALVAHPGFAATQLYAHTLNDGGITKRMRGFIEFFSQNEHEGAMGILKCMCDPNVQSGEFHGPGKSVFALKGLKPPFPLEPFYDNEATRHLLWSKSCEAVGKEYMI